MERGPDPGSVERLREMYTILGIYHNWWTRFWRLEWCGPWNRREVVEAVVYAALGTVIAILLGVEREEVKETTERDDLAGLCAAAGPVTALIGVLFMKVRARVWKGTLVFVVCWFLPLCILLGLIFTRFYSLVAYAILAYCPASVTYFSVLHSIRTRISLVQTPLFATILTSSLCALVPFWGVAFTIYEIVRIEDLDKSFVERLIYILSIPFLLSLLLAWNYLHFLYFQSNSVLISPFPSTPIPPLSLQLALKHDPEYLTPTSLFTRIQSKSHLISSLVQLVGLISIEIGLLVLTVRYVNGEETKEVMSLVAFYVPALPLFTFIGVIFSGCSLDVYDKYWSGTVLGVALPQLGIYPVLRWSLDEGVTEVFSWVIGISFPASILYWLSLSLLYEHSQPAYRLLTSVCCLTVLIPVGVILPLYKVGGVTITTFWAVFASLCM